MSLHIYVINECLRELMRQHIAKRRSTDSGCDLMCPEFQWNWQEKIDHSAWELRLGVHCAALTEDGKPAPYLLLARSSTSMTPLRLANQIGLADMGYRGELIARVDVNPVVRDYRVPLGTRLFQVVQHNWMPWKNIILVDRLEDLPPAPDTRGAGGFGSTGT